MSAPAFLQTDFSNGLFKRTFARGKNCGQGKTKCRHTAERREKMRITDITVGQVIDLFLYVVYEVELEILHVRIDY